MSKSFWDTEEVLAEIEKNDRGEKIVIKRCTKGEKGFVDIRTFFVDKDEELRPGKGIAIPEGLTERVTTALQKLKGEN